MNPQQLLSKIGNHISILLHIFLHQLYQLQLRRKNADLGPTPRSSWSSSRGALENNILNLLMELWGNYPFILFYFSSPLFLSPSVNVQAPGAAMCLGSGQTNVSREWLQDRQECLRLCLNTCMIQSCIFHVIHCFSLFLFYIFTILAINSTRHLINSYHKYLIWSFNFALRVNFVPELLDRLI